jgi:hypothetical protein
MNQILLELIQPSCSAGRTVALATLSRLVLANQVYVLRLYFQLKVPYHLGFPRLAPLLAQQTPLQTQQLILTVIVDARDALMMYGIRPRVTGLAT